jgi:hypothetical protein
MRRRPSPTPQFANQAVSAFERTYSALFEQAHIEVNRLERVNNAMGMVEDALLDPERIAEMEPSQQIALAELLSRTSNVTIRNLVQFGNLFMNIRSVVGLLDGVQQFTGSSLPEDLESIPQLENSHVDDGFEDPL